MSDVQVRQITVTAKAGGAKRPEDRTEGFHAVDSQTGANLWVPRPVRRNGVEVYGREAAAHIAEMLLLVQAAHGRVGWDRETDTRTVFTVFSA